MLLLFAEALEIFMKLLLAIVNSDDAHAVNSKLNKAGFSVTKISTTGGFLKNGNTTFLLGVDDSDTEKVIEIVKSNSKKREQRVPASTMMNAGAGFPQPEITVTVGGATVFVLNVEDCRHL